MSFHSKFAMTSVAVLLSTTGVLAQVGGSDVPSDAESAGRQRKRRFVGWRNRRYRATR